MFITDHNKLHPKERLDRINDKYAPFMVFQGIEVTLTDDNYEDFIVLGVHHPAIEAKDWTYAKLYNFVKKVGGYIILAHPYRFSDRVNHGVWDNPPDAVEVLSSNIGGYQLEQRKELAKALKCPVVTNSDSHDVSTTGCYTNTLLKWCFSEEEIIAELKAGRFDTGAEQTRRYS